MIMSTTKGHNMNDWDELIADLEVRGEISDLEGIIADWYED